MSSVRFLPVEIRITTAALMLCCALSARAVDLITPEEARRSQQAPPVVEAQSSAQDPMAPLIRMHAEIEALAERVGTLLRLARQEERWDATAPELRRTLFALEALLRLHLTVEEEMLADLQVQAH